MLKVDVSFHIVAWQAWTMDTVLLYFKSNFFFTFDVDPPVVSGVEAHFLTKHSLCRHDEPQGADPVLVLKQTEVFKRFQCSSQKAHRKGDVVV